MSQQVDLAFLHKEFGECADHAKAAFEHAVPAGFKPTLGKHEAKNHESIRRTMLKAMEECPDAASTIAWLLWHDIREWNRLHAMTKGE